MYNIQENSNMIDENVLYYERKEYKYKMKCLDVVITCDFRSPPSLLIIQGQCAMINRNTFKAVGYCHIYLWLSPHTETVLWKS